MGSPSCLLVWVSLLGLRFGCLPFQLESRWRTCGKVASPLFPLLPRSDRPTNINRQLASVIPELRQSPVYCMAGPEPIIFEPQFSRLRVSPSAIRPIAWGHPPGGAQLLGADSVYPGSITFSADTPEAPIEVPREEGKNDRLKSSVFFR